MTKDLNENAPNKSEENQQIPSALTKEPISCPSVPREEPQTATSDASFVEETSQIPTEGPVSGISEVLFEESSTERKSRKRILSTSSPDSSSNQKKNKMVEKIIDPSNTEALNKESPTVSDESFVEATSEVLAEKPDSGTSEALVLEKFFQSPSTSPGDSSIQNNDKNTEESTVCHETPLDEPISSTSKKSFVEETSQVKAISAEKAVSVISNIMLKEATQIPFIILDETSNEDKNETEDENKSTAETLSSKDDTTASLTKSSEASSTLAEEQKINTLSTPEEDVNPTSHVSSFEEIPQMLFISSEEPASFTSDISFLEGSSEILSGPTSGTSSITEKEPKLTSVPLNEISQVLSGLPQEVQVTTVSMPNPVTAVKSKKPNICGAERKRRKKAKLAKETALASSESLSPKGSCSSTGTIFKAVSSLPSKNISKGQVNNSGSGVITQTNLPPPELVTETSKQSLISTATTNQTPASSSDFCPNNILELTICREDNYERGFTENEMLEFMDAVGEVMNKTSNGNIPNPLQFTKTHLSKGQIVVTAANMYSKRWLSRNLPNIKPWPSTRLAVFKQKLQRLRKAIISIPSKNFKSTDQILGILERQNPGLNLSSWKIWAREEEPGNVKLVVGMNGHSVSYISQLDFRLFYSVTRVLVLVPSMNNSKTKKRRKKKKETVSTVT